MFVASLSIPISINVYFHDVQIKLKTKHRFHLTKSGKYLFLIEFLSCEVILIYIIYI